jgi:hypothetical protein
MRQVGHPDPKVTLASYAQVMLRGEGERERLRALVEGSHWALWTPRPIPSVSRAPSHRVFLRARNPSTM